METRFKAGDAVVVKDGCYCNHPVGSPYNLPRTIGFVKKCTADYLVVIFNGDTVSPPLSPECFELAYKPLNNESLFETKTIRTIRPGSYGCFDVEGSEDGYVKISVNQSYVTMEDLEHGIHLFQQLVEHLKEERE